MAPRHSPLQGPPGPAADHTSFPTRRIGAGTEGPRQYRTHRAEHEPGWFSSGVGGRFTLESPRGTLYTATGPEISLRELIGPRLALSRSNAVPSSMLADQVVSTLIMSYMTVADFCSPAALHYGIVPGEISGALPDYEIPRQWARALDDAGFSGISYPSRFTPATLTAWCLATFGETGSHYLEVETSEPAITIAESILDLVVAPVPHDTDITIIEPQAL